MPRAGIAAAALLLAGIAHSAPDRIKLGPPQLLYMDSQRPSVWSWTGGRTRDPSVAAIDAPMATLRVVKDSTDYFFSWSGGIVRYRGPHGRPFARKVWEKPRADGPDERRLSAGVPDSNRKLVRSAYLGNRAKTDLALPNPRAKAVWLANIYKSAAGPLLGFLHIEDLTRCEIPYDRHVKYRIGLAWSANGDSWSYAGDILAPKASEDTAGISIASGNNLSGIAYVVVGDWFHVYFNEYRDLVQGPPSWWRGMRTCVARARVDSVLKAAAEGRVTAWQKRYRGGWGEPGMGGDADDILPQATNPDQVNFHSDATYCKPLKRYLMLVPSVNKHRLSMYSSADGIEWGGRMTIDSMPGTHFEHCFFSGLASASEDSREVGAEFHIIYPRTMRGKQSLYRRRVTIAAPAP